MLPPTSSLTGLPVPPWSGKALRRLGEAIRDNLPLPTSGPTYREVVTHYDDLGVCVLNVIENLDWKTLLPGRQIQLASRAKTIDTLRDKLQRDRATPLGNVQDVAGVRFEAEMTLDEQDAVVASIVQAFEHDPACVHDMRATPHAGYRAVHVWLRLPGGRVEVQVRTHIQGAWANAYEELADVVGRFIRYDDALPDNPDLARVVQSMRGTAVEAAVTLEEARNLAARAAERVGADDPAVAQMVKSLQAIEASYTEATHTLRAMFKKMGLV